MLPLLFSGIHCKPVPTWEGIVTDTDSTSYRTTIDYGCTDGMVFEKGGQNMLSVCNILGEWDPPIHSCIGW